jgi:ArsR family transcriptional regulator
MYIRESKEASMEIHELQAEFFRALSSPVRIRILNALRDNNSCVCDLTKILGETQPQVSRHLTALKTAGILIAEKSGKRTCHRIKNKDVFKLMELSINLIRDKNEKILDALEKGDEKHGKTA